MIKFYKNSDLTKQYQMGSLNALEKVF